MYAKFKMKMIVQAGMHTQSLQGRSSTLLNQNVVVPSKLSIWVRGLTAANLSAINRNMTTVQQTIPSRLTVFFFTDGHHSQPQCNAAHLTCSNFNIKPSLTSIVVNNPTRHTTVLLSQLSLLFLRKKKTKRKS